MRLGDLGFRGSGFGGVRLVSRLQFSFELRSTASLLFRPVALHVVAQDAYMRVRE